MARLSQTKPLHRLQGDFLKEDVQKGIYVRIPEYSDKLTSCIITEITSGRVDVHSVNNWTRTRTRNTTGREIDGGSMSKCISVIS
jgi:hypothetical protein